MIVSIIWCLSGIAIGIVFASFFEWVLHKYVMHRPVGKFRYAFQAHAIVHHGTFKADKTYHLLDEKDKETIPMAWWNGPVLVIIGVLPFVLLALMIGQCGWKSLGGSASSMATTCFITVTCTRISMWCCRWPISAWAR